MDGKARRSGLAELPRAVAARAMVHVVLSLSVRRAHPQIDYILGETPHQIVNGC
jgi:hypothetical protein